MTACQSIPMTLSLILFQYAVLSLLRLLCFESGNTELIPGVHERQPRVITKDERYPVFALSDVSCTAVEQMHGVRTMH